MAVFITKSNKTVTSLVMWDEVTLPRGPAIREIQSLLFVSKLKNLEGFEE
jgi:hypothetical protein